MHVNWPVGISRENSLSTLSWLQTLLPHARRSRSVSLTCIDFPFTNNVRSRLYAAWLRQ
jgi:hypothetical protein